MTPSDSAPSAAARMAMSCARFAQALHPSKSLARWRHGAGRERQRRAVEVRCGALVKLVAGASSGEIHSGKQKKRGRRRRSMLPCGKVHCCREKARGGERVR